MKYLIIALTVLLVACKSNLHEQYNANNRVRIEFDFCDKQTFGFLHKDSFELFYNNLPSCYDTSLSNSFFRYGGLLHFSNYTKNLYQRIDDYTHYYFYYPFRLLNVSNNLKDTVYFWMHKDNATIKPYKYELRLLRFGRNYYDWTTRGEEYDSDIDYPMPISDTVLFYLAPNESHKFIIPARECYDSLRLTFKFHTKKDTFFVKQLYGKKSDRTCACNLVYDSFFVKHTFPETSPSPQNPFQQLLSKRKLR